MKTQQIAQVSPFLMNDSLIISLDQGWIKVFGKIPTFSVSIDKDGKLNLCSYEQIIKGNKR
jgi:hypothetical protein